MQRRTLIALAVLLSTAFATVWYVHPDSTQNCIQDCLDSCSTGDTVLVGAGTYPENIHWPATSGIKLLSEHGRDTTTIDGGGVDRPIQMTGSFDTTTVVSGFTMTNGYSEYGGGILCDSNASPLITDNLITMNTTYGTAYGHGGGIGLGYDVSPVIRGNIITSNRAAGSFSGGGGIFLTAGCAPIIENNSIEGNSSTAAGGGIMCHDGSAARIFGNTIRYDTAGIGTAGGGICSQRAATVIFGNTIAHNYAPLGGGLDSGEDDMSIIRGNTIELNVAYGHGGGGISCGNPNALIDSNDIRLNHAQRFGGGIVCQVGGTAPTISRNTLYGNSADSCGGGISCSPGAPRIDYNEVDSNWARARGGGIFCESSSPTIKGNRITRNSVASPSLTHAGGGIHIREQAHPDVDGNEISDNTAPFGGGVACYNWSNPQITNNRFVGNAADSVGGGLDIYWNSSPQLYGDTVVGNQAKLGGGISCWTNCSPRIENCSILGNTGDGVFCFDASSPTIHYCGIVGNSHYGVRNMYPGVTVDAESCWWGDTTGPFHPSLNPSGLGDTISDYVRFEPWVGVADERPRCQLLPSASATVLGGVLRLPENEKAVLLDISGRRVMGLKPGENDIRHVAPGVYFVRRPETEDGRPRAAVRKVVVQR